MRPLHALLCAVVMVAVACGTRSVEVADETTIDDPAGGAASSTTSSTTLPSTTTLASTTTVPTPTGVPTSTTTTTTPPFVLDEEGVPVNGQSDGVVITTTGWVVPVLDDDTDGWRVWTPCGREGFVGAGEFVAGADVVLDPGHGGSEPGAVGPGGTREADINLQVARRVRDALEADGYRVVMTRDSDVRVPIVTRAEIALALDPIANISIHHNAGTEAVSSEPGTEMFFQLASPESKRLAGLLYEETREFLDPLGSTWFALEDAGAMGRENRDGGDYYGVLRRPAGVTSVLAEFAYITNPVEEDLLNRADVQDGLAEAVRAAVERFVDTADPGSGFTLDPLFRGYGPSGAGRTTNCSDPALQ
ncbi:MAG: N-acetylmuramoyl-L-alanine amidase [Acidimicrobiales bacterium]